VRLHPKMESAFLPSHFAFAPSGLVSCALIGFAVEMCELSELSELSLKASQACDRDSITENAAH
jgi:hypothetical protein